MAFSSAMATSASRIATFSPRRVGVSFSSHSHHSNGLSLPYAWPCSRTGPNIPAPRDAKRVPCNVWPAFSCSLFHLDANPWCWPKFQDVSLCIFRNRHIWQGLWTIPIHRRLGRLVLHPPLGTVIVAGAGVLDPYRSRRRRDCDLGYADGVCVDPSSHRR